jgi:hypothetical protein
MTGATTVLVAIPVVADIVMRANSTGTFRLLWPPCLEVFTAPSRTLSTMFRLPALHPIASLDLFGFTRTGATVDSVCGPLIPESEAGGDWKGARRLNRLMVT